MADRKPVSERAGTKLNPDHVVQIYGRGLHGGRILHGLLDTRQRVYQTGGELKNFLYRRMNVISLGEDVWEQVKDRADRLEFIDHDANVGYVISIEDAEEHHVIYDAGIGRRIGFPLKMFEEPES